MNLDNWQIWYDSLNPYEPPYYYPKKEKPEELYEDSPDDN